MSNATNTVQARVDVPRRELGYQEALDRIAMLKAALDEYSTHGVFSYREHQQAMLAALEAAAPYMRVRWYASQPPIDVEFDRPKES